MRRLKVIWLALVWLLVAGVHHSTFAQSIRREYWLGLPGSSIADLVGDPAYPNSPSGVDFPTIFEGPVNWSDEYGTRMRGYLIPPTTGTYYFWIASDDQSQLLLSTDDSPSNNRIIASVTGWTNSREWVKEANQKSAAITLQAGQRYYIEAVQKEGAGGDNLAVGWQLPGGALERPIPGSRLAPYEVSVTPPDITSQPADLNLAEGEQALFHVSATGYEPLFFQWQRNGVDIEGEVNPTYILQSVSLVDNSAVFRCTVSNELDVVISREATLTVHPETIPPVVTALNPPSDAVVRTLSQIEVTFSEPVAGVESSDLLVNGQAATNVAGVAEGPYVFQFLRMTNGTAQISWVAGNGIHDLTIPPNYFAGTNIWNYAINANAAAPDIRINEFVAENISGLKDEDGEAQDWIEIVNRGTNAVNLIGWSLTDDPTQAGEWVFPARSLPPGQYLMIFASGKDRKPANTSNNLHTNFKLNIRGEYLGLYNNESPRQAVSELAPRFPEQRNDYSFGLDASNQWRYFKTPTPRTANGFSAISEILSPPHFSVERGYFNQAFNLILSSTNAGAVIRYTTDGSPPTETGGIVYTNPIPVTRTTVVRAAEFKTNYLPSTVLTHTYLYGLSTGQKSLPAISVVTATNNLLGPTGIIGIKGGTYVNGPWQSVNPGDYDNPVNHGITWERPSSAEWIRPQDNGGFQFNFGLRVHGSDWMRPRYMSNSKFSYTLYFRSDYSVGDLDYPIFGANSSVESFDKIVLRAGHNDDTNPFIKDELMRRLFIDTGQVGVHGTFSTLFVNGAYKGYFNPVERIDKSFCQSWFGGGSNWDVIVQFDEARDGDIVQWTNLRNFIASHDLSVPANYSQAGRMLDLTNFVDYLLVNIYGANGDWPANNWAAVRERAPDARFRYVIWDAEFALGTYGRPATWDTFANELNPTVIGSEIGTYFQAFKVSPEFRLLFADRINKHFFNNGALASANVTARFQELRRIMSGILPGMDTFIMTTWIPQRRNVIMGHFNNRGLLASGNAPVFNQFGGRVPRGFNLTMSATNGTIYFTTNGADPRVQFTGETDAEAQAYTGVPLAINASGAVKARTWDGSAWSALTEAAFQAAQLGVPLRITEIMYNPPGGDAYEFIELQNVGDTTLDLSGMSFDGVTFVFPQGSTLAPGATLVLSSDADPVAFATRYPKAVVVGRFSGSLSNGGERLALKDRSGQTIVSVTYNDHDGWPALADGGGYSLEIIDPNGVPDDPANWRASAQPGGSPSAVSSPPPAPSMRINEVMADNVSAVSNGGTYPDWIELFNAGANAVNLGGWSLSDDGNSRKFVFPPNVPLNAGSHLVVWCDSQTNAPGLHTGFALGRTGESIFLYDAQSNRVDAVSYGLQLPDYTVGRDSDGSWHLTIPTPGAANVVATLDLTTNLAINEWLSNPAAGNDSWIELFNRSTNAPVSLRGIYIGTSNALFQIRSLSFIAPGGFALFKADEQAGFDHLDFKLPATLNAIRLYDETGGSLDQIVYATQSIGLSVGRLPDGGANIVNFPTSASPGASNYLPAYNGPVLNEIMARNKDAVRDANGQAADWIELFNPNAIAFDLSGMSISLDAAKPGQWAFPLGIQIGANGYLLIWCDSTRAASTQLVANLNLGRSLSGEGGTVYLFNAAGQTVDSVPYGFQIENITIGRSAGTWSLLSAPTPGAANAASAALGTVSGLRLNEWMTAPFSGGDWFEIYNTGAQPVLLSGLYLTDDVSITGQTNFVIGPLSFIDGQSWVKFAADGNADKGPDHVNFRLDSLGETLRIYNGSLIVDNVDIYPQTPGVSQGRLPDGAANIANFPNTPTPAGSNYLPLPNVLINEVLSHTDFPLEDAVELFNPTALAVDISGWFLSNDQNDFKKFRVPDGTIVPAGGFKVIYENQFNGGGSTTPFTFNSAHGDAVYLSHADADGNLTGYRAQTRFDAASNGVSFGRYVTSVGEEQFVALSHRTFGADSPASVEQFRTGRGAPNAYPLVGPIVINEIMFHPITQNGTNIVENETEEFIELKNITTSAVPLFDPVHPTNIWKISGGVDYTFPANLTMPAGGLLLLVNFDPVFNVTALANFRGKYGLSPGVPLFGPYGGKLQNDGDSLKLFKPDPPQSLSHPDAGFVPYVLVEQIDYSATAPWPTNASGSGWSLQRIHVADFGNDPANWLAATPTPDAENLGSVADRDADRMPDIWEIAHGLSPDSAADAVLDNDSDGFSNLEEYLVGTDPNNGSDYLRIDSATSTVGGFVLHFQAVAGKTYTIQCSDAVAGGWLKLIDIDAQSANTVMQMTDPATNNATRYYRLVTPKLP